MNAHPRPYYYLENFTVALDWLRTRYRELLAADEQQFMVDFARLPLASAALVVRMIMRQGDLFRATKLNYAEIGCPRLAAAPLIDLGWLDPHPDLSFPNLCRLLRKAELWSALGLRGAARSVRKAELIPLVGPLAEETRPLDAWWPEAPDVIFHVRIASLCDRLRLMFFGNFYQTWSEFVLADLGIFRYEKIPLEDAARAFQTRAQVEQFHAIYRCRELLHAQTALEDVLAAVPPPLATAPAPLADTATESAPGNTWIEAKRAKLLFVIGQLYEKEHELPQALKIYKSCQHPEARLRTIRVLEKLERYAEAADLLTQVLEAPASELEAQRSARILPRLNRKLGTQAPQHSPRTRRHPHSWEDLQLELPHPGTHRLPGLPQQPDAQQTLSPQQPPSTHRPPDLQQPDLQQASGPHHSPSTQRLPAPPRQPNAQPSSSSQPIDLMQHPGLAHQPAPPLRVELAVATHLSTPNAPVLYVENTLLNSLFGLLCWNAIFAPLPGAFFHEFHAAPADLLEPDFHRKRAPLFSACFAELESQAYRDTILTTFDEKSGIQSPFVPWGALSREELELALDCIPATHLQKCFDRLLADIRSNRSGLPDLIQLWPAERRYKLIEVKGPGDRLQDNQVRWLNFCLTHAIPVCVCKVTWQTQVQS